MNLIIFFNFIEITITYYIFFIENFTLHFYDEINITFCTAEMLYKMEFGKRFPFGKSMLKEITIKYLMRHI